MRWIMLVSLFALAACAAPRAPVPSDVPDCAKLDKEPIDGGLGGTGNQPEADCQEE